MRTPAIVIAACLSTVVYAQAQTPEARNEQIVRQGVRAENFAEDTKNLGRSVGRQGIADRLNELRTTFPDYREEILDLVASGDKVVVRVKVSGTWKGVSTMGLANMPIGATPNGKRFEVTHTVWYVFRDGKVVERYANRDDVGMLLQLGVFPAAAKQ